MKRERIFESFLWNSRYIVIVAVAASLLVCLSMYTVATIDVFYLIEHIFVYIGNATGQLENARTEIVTSIVEIIDGYLLATMMLIFSFGLYELFISRINAAEGSELASRVLLIQNMDDLKERLTKLIFLILIVKFFQHALKQTFSSPMDLLYFSLGIFLLGAAVFISNIKGASHNK